MGSDCDFQGQYLFVYGYKFCFPFHRLQFGNRVSWSSSLKTLKTGSSQSSWPISYANFGKVFFGKCFTYVLLMWVLPSSLKVQGPTGCGLGVGVEPGEEVGMEGYLSELIVPPT